MYNVQFFCKGKGFFLRSNLKTVDQVDDKTRQEVWGTGEDGSEFQVFAPHDVTIVITKAPPQPAGDPPAKTDAAKPRVAAHKR